MVELAKEHRGTGSRCIRVGTRHANAIIELGHLCRRMQSVRSKAYAAIESS